MVSLCQQVLLELLISFVAISYIGMHRKFYQGGVISIDPLKSNYYGRIASKASGASGLQITPVCFTTGSDDLGGDHARSQIVLLMLYEKMMRLRRNLKLSD